MSLVRKIKLVVISFCISIPSMAWWGANGHRIVGEIAANFLSPKAKAAITQILGTESLAMASNWADFIKSDSNFNYLSPWHYSDVKQGLNFNEFKNELQHDTTANA